MTLARTSASLAALQVRVLEVGDTLKSVSKLKGMRRQLMPRSCTVHFNSTHLNSNQFNSTQFDSVFQCRRAQHLMPSCLGITCCMGMTHLSLSLLVS